MKRVAAWVLLCGSVVCGARAQAAQKVVVFWQPGFPTISSEPVERDAMEAAVGKDAVFADVAAINSAGALDGVGLLVLPYGSAVPADAWASVSAYIKHGGNVLLVGGQPLRVPVALKNGKYVAGRPQDSYALALGFRHTYEVPVASGAKFAWRDGYADGPEPTLKAKHFYAVEGRLDGLGYMVAGDGQKVAAPVIFGAHFDWNGRRPGASEAPAMAGRFVALDFDPVKGFWATADGGAVLRRAAEYARQGASMFSVETLYATLRPGESPDLTVHLRRAPGGAAGEVTVELLAAGKTLDTVKLALDASSDSLPVKFTKPLPVGFYEVLAKWSVQGRVREVYRNGFWVSPAEALLKGPVLGANADTLMRDGKPFLPVGTNYFTTEENGWDFSSPRNASIWEHDFEDMQAHSVSFVRTGVWMPNAKFVDPQTGGVNERWLRNLEGFLLSAQRHGIAVNFTLFAMSPKNGPQPAGAPGNQPEQRPANADAPPLPNPYLDEGMVKGEEAYVRSVVGRFGKVPSLSWDLINEPSFSNPRHIFSGNYPNGDPAELAAWHEWLKGHYASVASLADAWSVRPEELGSFDTVPLPAIGDLRYARNGSTKQVRAVDYNLFAQDMFRGWVKAMVGTIRNAGSAQVIDVGQDEGGATDRVLNRFFASGGVGFTTNHTYWEDDSLLWDSVAAKAVGTPNITGETGYQPSWAPDGAWRYDELTGLGLTERKWALGFSAGSTGAMQWDWAREVDFGMQRSDGSAKLWENMMRELGAFAEAAAPHAVGMKLPEIALVLPESLQLSVFNNYALEAQQVAVRTLYQEAHGAAYAVGEYHIAQLGTPKLILLPSPMGLTDTAWSAIEARVRAGATLLVTGPFDADAHLHATDRATSVGLAYSTDLLDLREETVQWPGGEGLFTFGGKKTTTLPRARFADGAQWKEIALGKGHILISALPLELGQNQEALGRVYAYAMQKSGVAPLREGKSRSPGVLICPTEYKDATLYVVTSETETTTATFEDPRSHVSLSTSLEAGRAALVMVGTDGKIIASYHWGIKK
jgi:hypothetical protein